MEILRAVFPMRSPKLFRSSIGTKKAPRGVLGRSGLFSLTLTHTNPAVIAHLNNRGDSCTCGVCHVYKIASVSVLVKYDSGDSSTNVDPPAAVVWQLGSP